MTNSPRPEPDTIRVRVVTADSPGAQPSEAFTAEIAPASSQGSADVQILSELQPVYGPRNDGAPPPSYALTIRTRALSWGGSHTLLEIVLELQEFAAGVATALMVDAIRDALKGIVGKGRGSTIDLTEEDALHFARSQVAVLYEDESYRQLQPVSVDHDRTGPRWLIELASPNGAKYEVELGFVKGVPTTARIKRKHPPAYPV